MFMILKARCGFNCKGRKHQLAKYSDILVKVLPTGIYEIKKNLSYLTF